MISASSSISHRSPRPRRTRRRRSATPLFGEAKAQALLDAVASVSVARPVRPSPGQGTKVKYRPSSRRSVMAVRDARSWGADARNQRSVPLRRPLGGSGAARFACSTLQLPLGSVSVRHHRSPGAWPCTSPSYPDRRRPHRTGDADRGNGVKQRLRLRLAEEGAGDRRRLVRRGRENDREIELEAKINPQKRSPAPQADRELCGASAEFYYHAAARLGS